MQSEKKIKSIYWKLHHWVGLYAGIIIAVLSLTGACAVFIPEVDSLVKQHYYQARSTPYAGAYPAFGKSLDTLTIRYPDYKSLSITLPVHKNDPVTVQMQLAGKQQKGRYEFFIDGGQDAILGQRRTQNSLANFMRQMHVRLYEGTWGRQLVGLAGISLFIVSLTGLLIYGSFMKKQRFPEVRRGLNLRIRMADWHKIFGIATLTFNLVISLTGAWLGLQPWLMKWFDITPPNRHVHSRELSSQADRALQIDWEQAFAALEKNFPELEPSRIVLSTDGKGVLGFSGRVKGHIFERNTNILDLSKQDYQVAFRYKVAEASWSSRFFFVQEALHFGDYGGLTLKVIYALLGLTSGFLSISGFIIYVYRKNRKHKNVEQGTLRVVFLYSLLFLLLLVLIAFVSLQIGYKNASYLAGILINASLIAYLVYALSKAAMRYWAARRLNTQGNDH